MTVASGRVSARPEKPRASLAMPLGLLAFAILTWAAASEQFGIGLDPVKVAEDIASGAGILGELLTPNWSYVPRTIRPLVETFQIAIIASVIGCAIALPVAFMASRITAPNAPTFLANRAVLSVVRAIPDILYALVFVAAVGIGPLAGIVALVLFNIGVVAKLLSETVDGIDPGPIEATDAAGAGRIQTVRWAVLPQVLPNYVAYSLYTFELNIRASTVIGITGAGGMGNQLFTQYRFFNWSNVSVIVIELFVFVFLIELVSIWLRRRLV